MTTARVTTDAGRELLEQVRGTNPWRLGDDPAALSAFVFAIEQEAREQMTTAVTRFEVIDHRPSGEGRAFVARPCTVELALQDDGQTLKVFVKEPSHD